MSQVPRAVLEAEERANKLHEELISSRQQQQNPEDPPTDQQTGENQPTDQQTNQESQAPSNDSQQPPQDDGWEHRFKVLQGKYNSEVPRLANENRDLKARLEGLSTEVEKLKSKPAESLVSDAEIEEYGEGLVDLARRIAKEEVMQKEHEIDTLKAQIRNLSEATTNTQSNDFFRTLSAMVPNWERINEDPAFIRWLEEFDEFAGETKQSLLSKAEVARDASRVAKFFTSYQKANSTWAANSSASLENQVAPPTNKSADAPPSKKIWMRAEISDFYSRLKRGLVSDKDAIAIEADITAASIEGRIR